MTNYCLYIVNNENISKRVSGIRDELDYTISSINFTLSKSNERCIFQMLKDTFFNNISPEGSDLEYTIVAIKNTGSNQQNKQLILDYMNSDKIIESIKPILTFTTNLSNINSSKLVMKSKKNIDLECTVNTIENNKNSKCYYISNPTFIITSSKLKELLLV